MREIKFRGMDIYDKKFAYGWLADIAATSDKSNKGWRIIENIRDGNLYTPVLPNTIGQFTGLKDKNGKEIYEGDVFEGPFYDMPFSPTKHMQTRRGSVQWNPDQGCIPYPTTGDFKFRFFPTWHECEVIGNIYENPEFLQEVKA